MDTYFKGFRNLMKINKVVIYGHKLYKHTHSYAHYGFFKAFKFLGYDTVWLDENDNVSDINFKNSLFITEGQTDNNIPMNSSSYYCLHNCGLNKYKENNCKILSVQVLHTKKYLQFGPNNFQFFNPKELSVVFPWGTDLLPMEIEKLEPINNFNNLVYWIGTYGGGEFGNVDVIHPLELFCKEKGLEFIRIDPWASPVSIDEHVTLIRQSFFSPSFQGKWQLNAGYIPCRVLKLTSYGQYPITNSIDVYNLFQEESVLLKDLDFNTMYEELYKIKKDLHLYQKKTKSLQNYIKENHTYLNRCNFILNALNEIYG